MKLYVSNKDETPRMFENDFMEFFSRVHWTVPLWVYSPVVLYFIYSGFFEKSISMLGGIGLFILGLFLWTIVEYTLHQFVFHYHPTSKIGKRLIWMFHGIHHDYPSDSLRLVMPPSVSLPLAILFFYFWKFIFGIYVDLFFAGFIVGYLFYDIGHYAIHHFPMKGAYWGYIREYHMRHHFKSPERGFGVSSPLWDIVFRTGFDMKSTNK
ncbi:MAG: sterol desaturase family protein [Chloroherpetonaceae bacterium]|nr:sterol desaturase family protein [Chloroherpetonaceae bacterium]